MNKQEFLSKLKTALSGLPQDDINERLAFYSEMIDDRMEDGVNESDAVASIGHIDDIVLITLDDTSITKLVKEKITPKRTLKSWEIILIILGFPLWLPLLIAAGLIVLSLYIVVWALIISLWVVELSVIISSLSVIAASIISFIYGNTPLGIASLGAGLVLGGLSIFLFFACVAAVKATFKLTKKTILDIKSMFISKESAK